MTDILKKLKLDLTLIFAAALLTAGAFIFSAAAAPEISVCTLNISEKTQDVPQDDHGKISHIKYALQQIYRTNSIFRQISARKISHPIPSAYRYSEQSSLPLVKLPGISLKPCLYKGELSHFQKYIKYALPRRAGPFTV